MSYLRGTHVIFIVTMLMSVSASAQVLYTTPRLPFSLPSFIPSPSGEWTVTIGAGGELKPDFEGAKRYSLSPVPIFSIHRAGSNERFRGPRDGADFGFFDFGGFRLGPVVKYRTARSVSGNTALYGLGGVKYAIEAGAFAEYFPVDWFRARVELRHGFGGHEGIVADFSADVILPVLERFTLSGGPRFTLENTKATAPYFSITPIQALASGLPVFDAKGGAHSVGAGAQLRYQFDPQWEVHSYVEYERLLGGAAKSPLVTGRGSRNQVTIGIGASYSFDVRVP
ncbi:outer membrane protein [Rhizobiales bacterium GAS191]|jgi:outer membrane protein|nr:outer membrane protein [Rhizobiales bacterium GAS113]SEE65633.1 outer membrane protein [Rhizobiales bacterium GAS191]